MSFNHPKHGHSLRHQSEAQRQTNSAMTQVMLMWEALEDQQRLAWEMHGSLRRKKGISVFKEVNLRRLQRGDSPAPLPLPLATHDPRPLLVWLEIRNRGGWITLRLHLRRTPDSRRTVWASLPCNRGLKKPHKCPRLGWLPVSRRGICDITVLYFSKHGARIREENLAMVGKRIFVRIRSEADEGVNQYEEVAAVVPFPEPKNAKNPNIPPKDHRKTTE